MHWMTLDCITYYKNKNCYDRGHFGDNWWNFNKIQKQDNGIVSMLKFWFW